MGSGINKMVTALKQIQFKTKLIKKTKSSQSMLGFNVYMKTI